MPWLEQCREWVGKYDPVRPEYLEGEFHHYGFMRRLSEKLPANAIIVSDTGGNVIMMGHCFRSKQGQRIFTSNGNTPMGFALAGAIGAWFADPSRPVICIIGDGGMQMNIQELQTIKHYGCKIKVFIINNHILGNTKSYQRVNGKAELACGPDGYSSPDFCAIAKAYGIHTQRVDKYWNNSNQSYQRDTFEEIVPFVLNSKETEIMDVVHHDFCTYEPRLSRWDGAVEEMYPPLSEEEFLANMLIAPLKGWEQRR